MANQLEFLNALKIVNPQLATDTKLTHLPVVKRESATCDRDYSSPYRTLDFQCQLLLRVVGGLQIKKGSRMTCITCPTHTCLAACFTGMYLVGQTAPAEERVQMFVVSARVESLVTFLLLCLPCKNVAIGVAASL